MTSEVALLQTASIICKKNYLTLLKELGLAIDHPQESEKTTLSPNLVPCGNTYCKVDLHEVGLLFTTLI